LDLVQTLQSLQAQAIDGEPRDLLRAVGSFYATRQADRLGNVAEFERDLLRERVKSGLAAARARGRVLGRQKGFRPKLDGARFGSFGSTQSAGISGNRINYRLNRKRAAPIEDDQNGVWVANQGRFEDIEASSDRIDQRPDLLHCLGRMGRVFECLVEFRDFLSIELGQVGVEQ
jgi:hypothetical protein